MPTPTAPQGSYDPQAARRGQAVFNGSAKCSTCHVPPIFTEPGYNSHTAEEIGIDSFQADRGPERRYVTTPLRALFDTEKIHKGGFYHDGRFPTLDAVVSHYDSHFKLQLTAAQKRELVEYLKSL
jgi:cytochrome c peroxidase